MNTTETLQQELQTLQARQVDLTAERDAAGAALSDEREAVVEGTGKTQTLIAKQNAHAALSGAVEELQRRIEQKQQAIAQAQAADKRHFQVQEMACIAAAMNGGVVELDEVTNQVSSVLNFAVARTAELTTKLTSLRAEFVTLSEAVGVGDVPPELELGGVRVDSKTAVEWRGDKSVFHRIRAGEDPASRRVRDAFVKLLILIFEERDDIRHDALASRLREAALLEPNQPQAKNEPQAKAA